MNSPPAAPSGALARLGLGEELVVTTDTLVDGVHFPSDTPAADVAFKALAVNLSDLAAMGASPHAAQVTLLDGRRPLRWRQQFETALADAASEPPIALQVRSHAAPQCLVIVLALGRVPAGRALRRDGARDGDELWVSGTLGDAGGALALLAAPSGTETQRYLLARLRRPTPRLALGRALRGVATSAIDVSDGLTGDVGHLCERSRLAARIESTLLPISSELRDALGDERAEQLALAAGDDYEICFTAPAERADAVIAAARDAATAVTRIGAMCVGDAVQIRDRNGHWQPAPSAYQHFTSRDD